MILRKINEFAVEYYILYANPKTKESEVRDGFFEKCANLGFEDDGGKRFIEEFSEDAFYRSDALEEIIDEVQGLGILGSAIFSRWQYMESKMALLDYENRMWFLKAFGRLALISEEERLNPFIFRGKLKKIELVSNNIGFNLPSPYDEVEQHFSMMDEGRVFISRYVFGTDKDNFKLIESSSFEISKEKSVDIMDAVKNYFSEEYTHYFSEDEGFWQMKLTNDEGKIYKIVGPIFDELNAEESELSDFVRLKLGRDDLFLFDGNPDSVSKIEVKYRKKTSENDFFRERLIIDGNLEAVEYIREIGKGRKTKNIYYIKDEIKRFLKQIDIDKFLYTERLFPEDLEEMISFREYEMKVSTKLGEAYVIKDNFDLDGLPIYWDEFVSAICNIIGNRPQGDIFSVKIYKRPRRRKSDYIYCSVEFEEYGDTYYYIADSDDYEEGDFVIVPAGEKNAEKIVRIEDIEYFKEEDVPYPLEKTKHIIRKYDRNVDGTIYDFYY